MRQFSWYTDSKPHISTYLNGAPKKRYLVVDGIAVVGRAVMHYKPNRKGEHRHNHIRNALERKLNRSKASRNRCHNHLNKGYNYKFTAGRCFRRAK